MNKQFNNFKKTISKTFLTFSLIGISTIGAYAAENGTTTSDLNMRQGKSVHSKVVTVIPKGASVTILDNTGYWFKIKYNGHEGYSYRKYLKETNTSNDIFQSKENVIVTAYELNVRTGPNTNYSIIKQVKRNDSLNIVDKNKSNGWLKVQFDDGSTGWVSGKYVTITSNDTINITSQDVQIADGPAQVTVSELNVRTGNNIDFPIITQLKKNDIVAVVARSKSTGWLKIQFKNGSTGWISDTYVIAPDLESLNLDINNPIFK